MSDTNGDPSSAAVPEISVPQPRVPGEFEKQEAVVIGCAQLIQNFPQVFVNVIRSIYRHVRVLCLTNKEDMPLGRVLLAAAGVPRDAVEFVTLPAVSMWARDWMPISGFDVRGRRQFLGFELRHLRTSADAAVRPEMEKLFDSPVVDIPLTHEGGNLLSNGAGLCLTSTTVLLKNASRGYDSRRIGQVLSEHFGVYQWAYLNPLSGEQTGHVDLFCTFVARDTVVVGEFDPSVDAINAEVLDRAAEILSKIEVGGKKLTVARVPTPAAVDGKYRSYTNVVFANGAVLVPLYPEIDEQSDQRALAVYKELMPDREVVGIDISELSKLGGGLHCLTANVCPPKAGGDPSGPDLLPRDSDLADGVGVRRA